MRLGRLGRTLVKLHPLQVAARIPNALMARTVRAIPAAMPPRIVEGWSRPPPRELRAFANSERTRGAERLRRLPAGRLRDYESCYGLELGGDDAGPVRNWSTPVAIEPYPASVRARRIAVAIRCGRAGLEPELARAARAIVVRPELHLMGNHLLENGFALACAGAVTRGAEADIWWNVGQILLNWQLPAQFLGDGGHVERSASYHLALTAALLESIELAEASGRVTPALWREVASRALGWATTVRAPDGTYPLFNDASLDAAPAADDVLTLGAGLGVHTESLSRRETSEGASAIVLEATGWMRLDCEGACLFVDTGPDAEGWQPGHAHADGLTFELWTHGARSVVDFGVASYQAGTARTESRATRSHNTVELAGEDSCEVWGTFRVGRRGRGRIRDSAVGQGEARVHLEHDGYSWRAGAPRHERRLSLRRGALRVEDRVIGGGSDEWVSRLRVDAAAIGRLRISGMRTVVRRDDRWYPRHGDARPAVVLEQRAQTAAASAVAWEVCW